jgi:hypothetical protein
VVDGAATLRAASAAPRARRRDGAGGACRYSSSNASSGIPIGITSIYLQGIDNTEIIDTVHAGRAPMIPVQGSLRV